MDEKAMEAQLLELVCYLWDNYIQLYDTIEEIFLLGVGNAYLGVKALLMNRGTDWGNTTTIGYRELTRPCRLPI